VNKWLRIDDGLYVFKLHGIGGMCGSFMTGIFADQGISAMDGLSLYPGGVNGNGIQVGKQFAEITAISSYSFIVSLILLMGLKYIPYMHLRVDEDAEMKGLDYDQFFDEQIGEWEFDHFGSQGPLITTHGVNEQQHVLSQPQSSAGSTVEAEAVRAETKA
jgi:Amt family ammonium transporter